LSIISVREISSVTPQQSEREKCGHEELDLGDGAQPGLETKNPSKNYSVIFGLGRMV
jgi:hypothetical protein